MKIEKKHQEFIKALAPAHNLTNDELADIIINMGLVSFLKELQWYGSVEEFNKCLATLKAKK